MVREHGLFNNAIELKKKDTFNTLNEDGMKNERIIKVTQQNDQEDNLEDQ